MEEDAAIALTRMGTRHVSMSVEGMWLQPEPLLHLGPTPNGMPRAWWGPYAAGDTNQASDKSGYYVETAWDAANVAWGAQSFASNLSEGNYGAAALDALGMAFDGAAVLTPAPGGAGAMIRAARAADTIVDTAQTLRRADTVGDAARGLDRAGDACPGQACTLAGQCFVEDTIVLSPAGGVRIDEIRAGDLVIASAATGHGWKPEQVVLPRKEPRSWLAGACSTLKSFAGAVALPATLASGCGLAELPSHGALVEVYDPWTGDWTPTTLEQVAPGADLVHGGRLFHLADSGLVDLGEASESALEAAGRLVTRSRDIGTLGLQSWVLVLADGDIPSWHSRIETLGVGSRFAFDGWIYELAGDGELTELRTTGEVLARVAEVFVRPTDEVVEVDIVRDGGTLETLAGTNEHPFWVPASGQWVALGELDPGTVLHTSGGEEAVVLATSFVPGDVQVYNFEVEGLHNYFVRGADGERSGVLVHNSCPGGGGSAGSCFVAGTTILTKDGPKAIETVELGDLVAAHEHSSGSDVYAPVTTLFVRTAPEVIDATVSYADGTLDSLTGTPNHPFWVDAVRDYVPLGDLEVGTGLHVQGGGKAILVSKTWRQGDFEVFDFEVEGLHNFYVRGEGSDAAGVLVHNSTQGRDALGRFLPGAGGTLPTGGAAEQLALGRRGLDKNTTRTPAYSGDAAFRIPDGSYDADMRHLVEIKDVDSMSMTSQLRDSLTHATRGGGAGSVELVVDTRTTLSGPLQSAVDNPEVPLTLSREPLR
jgi:hypothetical protein